MVRRGGAHADIRGRQADLPGEYASDDYTASQAFGEAQRAAAAPGILYDSLRHAGGVNIATFRPSLIADVAQANHWRVAVLAKERRIEVKRLAIQPPSPARR
jgi:hypothetical protein